MNGPILIVIADLLLLIILVVIKTILFYKATRKRTFKRWLYFSRFHIEDAYTEDIKARRKRQNVLSVVLLIVLVISAIIIPFAIMAFFN